MEIKAILFDVFGTVVDWRTSIAKEARTFGEKHNVSGDWFQFADQWRHAYNSQIHEVNSGKRKWISVDEIHKEKLVSLLKEYRFPIMNESEICEFNNAWHRLKPWPDAVPGLTRLKSKYTIATLSNGNISLLTNMAKNAGLPWDAILSSEIVKKYKPDPSVYQNGAKFLGQKPSQTLMVAAHKFDLIGALASGLRVAMVVRPREFGSNKADLENDSKWDFYSTDFNDLADQLSC
ncbi:haloacid dehalogenase type II [Dehalococcoidia bacterium]|nr:haloacid dehalogenase type II [Dehalococcoidia bacterium]